MSADVAHENFGDRIEDKFARLRDHQIAFSHQEIRGIYRLEDILVVDAINPGNGIAFHVRCEAFQLSIFVEKTDMLEAFYLFLEQLIYL